MLWVIDILTGWMVLYTVWLMSGCWNNLVGYDWDMTIAPGIDPKRERILCMSTYLHGLWVPRYSTSFGNVQPWQKPIPFLRLIIASLALWHTKPSYTQQFSAQSTCQMLRKTTTATAPFDNPESRRHHPPMVSISMSLSSFFRSCHPCSKMCSRYLKTACNWMYCSYL